MSDVSVIDQLIEPVTKDLGEFTVRRLLPSKRRLRIGPFIFFDHMGPADFPPGTGVNVRAHPHIGLAAITYLFEGDRIVWWNFVSSSRARLELAKRDWRNKRFPEVPGETDFIPLPKS